MAKFITVKMITDEVPPPEAEDARAGAVQEEGEDDGMERDVQSASASLGRSGARTDWKPNTISVDAIRNWYPRKGGRPGCRLIMKTGTAYIVVDEHEEILELIRNAVNAG